jgi:hypothetical protein
LPFNKYAYLTTHNSYAIVGEPSHTGIPRITFDNQEDTVTDQLNVPSDPSIVQISYYIHFSMTNYYSGDISYSDDITNDTQNGVRALMLDTYDFKGDVWLCHSNGGKCNDFTAFVSILEVPDSVESQLKVFRLQCFTIPCIIVGTSIRYLPGNRGISFSQSI